MDRLAFKLYALLATVHIALGWFGYFLLKAIFPDQYFQWYPLVPIVFLLLGMIILSVITKSYRMEAKKLVNVYLMLKLIKMLVLMAFALIFFFVVRKDLKVFGVVLATFYVVYLAVETYMFYKVEKQIKKES